MTSLSEAYHGDAATRTGRRRLAAGAGLFTAGVLLVVAGILVAGTELLLNRGYGLGDIRLYGGILGGIGVPAVFLGIFTVLPASRNTRAAAVVGACLSVFGVALFVHAYPCGWIGNSCAVQQTDLTLPTAGMYSLGVITTFWCLFTGVVNFKTRNDPGGTVTMNITRRGETKVVEVEKPLSGFGSVGLFGSDPDGEVETQTNAVSPTSDGGEPTQTISSPMDQPSPSQTASTDRVDTIGPKSRSNGQSAGKTTTNRPSDAAGTQAANTSNEGTAGGMANDESVVEYQSSPQSDGPVDRYCGSCSHFQYVRTDDGIQPYCGYHSALMDDMDPCEEWTRR
ncbi:DUF7139 domain-containing protein [Halalkalirubrum salinum]|uniref:DUF7139 domain-containing protein n=1 Tax=Halalkalirubrum salinum TaxID=2563889 RepID=UPI0010FBB375|nr:ribonuclease BN [Halalkalirubrum salinum]